MPGITRYETDIEDGTFSLEHEDGWIEVGPVDGVVELIGGETYVLEYTDEQAAAAWLDTDENNQITVDVRDTLETMTYQKEFVSEVAAEPLEDGDSGYPRRAELFAEKMVEILEARGNMDNEGD